MHDNDILARNWFVLTAVPNREHDAAQLLRDRGTLVIQPLELRRHRPNHHSKRRWNYMTALMGRYIIAGFAEQVPPWLDILEHSALAGVVDYRPIRRFSILKLILEFGNACLEPPDWRRKRTSIEEIVPDCDVLILSGPYAGKSAKVESIVRAKHGKNRASVLLPVFGGRRAVELPLEELEREVAA